MEKSKLWLMQHEKLDWNSRKGGIADETQYH